MAIERELEYATRNFYIVSPGQVTCDRTPKVNFWFEVPFIRLRKVAACDPNR